MMWKLEAAIVKGCLRYDEHGCATDGRTNSVWGRDDTRQTCLYPVTSCRCDRAKVTALVDRQQPTQ